jgi:hypothetical protein
VGAGLLPGLVKNMPVNIGVFVFGAVKKIKNGKYFTENFCKVKSLLQKGFKAPKWIL